MAEISHLQVFSPTLPISHALHPFAPVRLCECGHICLCSSIFSAVRALCASTTFACSLSCRCASATTSVSIPSPSSTFRASAPFVTSFSCPPPLVPLKGFACVVRIGSKVLYNRLPWNEPWAPYFLEVLYEDDDMVALNKPSGLQVLPGGLFQQRTVLRQLQWQASKCSSSSQNSKSAARGEQHPTPVHRLGRGTSGILLCAKTKLARACLAAYFAHGTSEVTEKRTSEVEHASRKILKFYRALVQGILSEDEVVIKQPIGVMNYPGVAKGLYVASISGKPAFSKVKIIERNAKENQTLVQVEIHSGRPHQIRIHLAFIGHPLVGDPLYVSGGHPNCLQPLSEDDTSEEDGGYHRPVNPVPGDCGYYLHAYQLVLCHPSTANKVVEIIAPPPPMLQTQEESCQIDS